MLICIPEGVHTDEVPLYNIELDPLASTITLQTKEINFDNNKFIFNY